MQFDDGGFPHFGKPVSPGASLLLPVGSNVPTPDLPMSSSLKTDVLSSEWCYFGHHQFICPRSDGLHLGVIPENPINDYRCGEKTVLDGEIPSDLTAEVTISFLGNKKSRDAGMLFRTTAQSVGYDAQRGYFAGLIPKTGLIILGKTDGRNWTELARTATEIDADKPQRLGIETIGDQIAVSLNGTRRIVITEDSYPIGSVGLRVVDTHAVFSDLKIRPTETKR